MARPNAQPGGPLLAALQETTTAATIRAAEGQKIFSPIAAFPDEHRSQTGLALHQRGALEALSNDLAEIAQRHFNAYISGVFLTTTALATGPAPGPVTLPPSPPPSRPASALAQSTYATVVKQSQPEQPP
jgi:hypothetical protein